MAENAGTTAKTENMRVTGTVPAELFARLFDGDRWDKRMNNSEYLVHVLTEYEKTLTPNPGK